MHDHDRGLSFDLSTLMTRRRALHLAAVGGLAAVVAGCGGSSSGSSDATTAGATTSGATGSAADAGATTAEIPEETAGPFPADGSNGVDVLGESGIVRSDITASFGSGSATAAGVPMAIALTVLDVAKGGAPVEGAAVYLWHCDREGRYSLYSRRDRERELPARRPGRRTRRGASPSPASGRAPTRGAGRTSTSRSTRASPRPRGADRSSSRRRSPCPRTPASASTPPAATGRARRT